MPSLNHLLRKIKILKEKRKRLDARLERLLKTARKRAGAGERAEGQWTGRTGKPQGPNVPRHRIW